MRQLVELSIALHIHVDQLVDLDDQLLATYLTILNRSND